MTKGWESLMKLKVSIVCLKSESTPAPVTTVANIGVLSEVEEQNRSRVKLHKASLRFSV